MGVNFKLRLKISSSATYQSTGLRPDPSRGVQPFRGFLDLREMVFFLI
jgi:hypothetical protein